MARIEYNAPTFTVNLPYYQNGVQSLVTPNVGVSLDPVDTPLYLSFNSETLPFFSQQKFRMTFGFYQTTSTNENDNNLSYFAPVDGDTIEIDGNIFTARNTLLNGNDFYAVTNPADILEQELAIKSLLNAILFNTTLNLRYNIELINLVDNGYFNTLIPLSPIYAIKIEGKDYGPSYNINVYDATLNPFGKIRATFTNYNVLNDNPNYAEYNLGLNTQVINNVKNLFFYIYSAPINRGQLLENNSYGMYLEVWVNKTSIYASNWGRAYNVLFTVYEKIVTLTQDWNISNNFIFEISNYLRPHIKIKFPTYNDIGFNYTNITYYHNDILALGKFPIVPYYCKYGEYFNGGFDKTQYLASGGADFLPEQIGSEDGRIDDPNIRYYEIGQTELRWACRGAFPENIVPASNIRYWMAKTSQNGIDIETNDEFTVVNLTNQPNIKLRRRLNAPEYMWFYLHNDEYVSQNRYYRIRYSYFMSDNLTVVTNVITVTNNSNLNNESGLYVVDLNLYNTQQPNVDLNFVENDVSLRCVYIKGFLEWSENNSQWFPYTAPFNYEIDMNTEYDNVSGQTYTDVNRTYAKLYWRNPHGVFDQFEFEFRESYELKTKETKFNSISKFDYNPSYGRDKAVINKIEIESELFYVIHSGWVNREHYLWLKELMESNEVYCANGFYIDTTTIGVFNISDTVRPEAIVITDFEWSLNEKDDLFDLKITYKPAFYSNNIKI